MERAVLSIGAEMSGSAFLSCKFIDNDQEEYFTYAPSDDTVTTILFLDVSGLAKQLLWAEHFRIGKLFTSNPKHHAMFPLFVDLSQFAMTTPFHSVAA